MCASHFVQIRHDGPTCIITLTRADKLNALSTALEGELRAALESPAVQQSRCIVLAGSDRAFSAGADVSEMRGIDPAGVLHYYRETGGVYELLAAHPRPTIAAITGYCLGGGLELALAADFRIAGESAVFGFPEVSIGIIPSSGGIFRLTRMVGPARAREMTLLHRRFGAREALATGLVTEIVADEEVLARALAIAADLAELPPLAVTVAKQTIDRAAESSRETAIALERLAYGMLVQTADAREAMTAFVEKRTPHFHGR